MLFYRQQLEFCNVWYYSVLFTMGWQIMRNSNTTQHTTRSTSINKLEGIQTPLINFINELIYTFDTAVCFMNQENLLNEWIYLLLI